MHILSLFLFLIITQIIHNQSIDNGIHIRIYDNIAEITRPISLYDLPINYSQDEWYDIRSDSIRLVGNCLDVRSQILSFNQTSLNGQKILIKRDINNDTYTEGLMIDEKRNLIQDLIDNTYYYLPNDRIRYLSIPSVQNYTVDFVIDSYLDEKAYLRYLQKNIKWKVQYDLLLGLNDTDSFLQAYADIRNNGNSLLVTDSAELISGDINIDSSSNFDTGNNYNQAQTFVAVNANTPVASSPTILESEELIGVYIFPINDTFILDPQSNYILPMFRPIIHIERYGLIEKYFSTVDNYGNAQRSYRFRVEDIYLPKGQVFVRESDRLVGETYWSDISANETNEFNLGNDPDLQYNEYIQLISRRLNNETSNNYHRSFLSTYTINLQLINNKQRSINIEYRLKFTSQEKLILKDNTINDLLQLDGASIYGVFQINANDQQEFKFTIEIE